MDIPLNSGGSKALEIAKKEAKQLCNKYAGTEHLLLGILALKEPTINSIFKKIGVDTRDIKQVVYDNVYQSSDVSVELNNIKFTPRVNKILEIAEECAVKLGRKEISPDHIFLGLLYEQNGVAVNVLKSFGISFRRVKREFHKQIDTVLTSPSTGIKDFEDIQVYKTEFKKLRILSEHSTNLTILAKEGKLDPVVGRQKEVARLMQILCRKTKNNPALVGDAGVGKTAIVELLAQKIASGDVPDQLVDKHIVAIDLASLVAGTKYRGQFEERMKKLLDEVKSSKNMILFVDEIHTIVNAGAATGSLDAGNILKPPLARGEVTCIGATTGEEYTKHVEKDKALDRRFQMIKVSAPTSKEALVILKGIKKEYETYHGVRYSVGALKAAVELSQRYIPDKQLPDSAIDVVDEAGAKASLAKDGNVITEEQIENIISDVTGVPIVSIDNNMGKFFKQLERNLKKDIVGQRDALKTICTALKCAHAHINDPEQPVGTFLFLGSTGVGKTYLCKLLAKYLFGTEQRLIRIDMSEFMEPHSVSKLIGSPPGYIGHDDHNSVIEQVRKYPYSLVLFDEIEKAHPQVLNLLLQVLDEGLLTDSHGRKINFKNTILVMTSNLGTEIYDAKTVGFVKPLETDKKLDVKEHALSELRPEFVNRIDDVIIFERLTDTDLAAIVRLHIKIFEDRLKKNYSTKVHIDSDVVDFIVKACDNNKYGARQIKRDFRTHVENQIAELLVGSNFVEGTIIDVSVQSGKIHINQNDNN